MGPRRGERHSPRFFEALAEHAGAAYLRYSFTRGTEQEVDFLTSALELSPGMRVVDVGCGPGRHVRALTDRGMDVVGIDISERFLQLLAGSTGGSPVRADARWLPVRPRSFDAAGTTGVSVKDIPQGAATSVLLAASPLVEGVTGRYFEDCQDAEPFVPGIRRGVAAYALDPEKAARLWQLSLDLLAA